MTNQSDNLKVEPAPHRADRFPLLRRLSLASLLAIFLTATLLVFLYWQDQLAVHAGIAAEENEKTLSHLTHALDGQLDAYVAGSARPDAGDMSAHPDLDSLFASELKAIHEDDALKLKIYNLAGTAIYSSARSEIGGTSKHPDYVGRALHGETVHDVEYRDTFLGMSGEMHDVWVAMTYMPLEHAGKRIGVIEIYDDATPIFKRLRANAIEIVLVVLGAFSALYAALFYAVFRADRGMAAWQNSVAESEQALNEAQHIAGLGSYVLDIPTGRWKSSDGLDRVFGIDASYERSAEGWAALFHPDDRAKMLDYMRDEVIAQRKDCNQECRIIRRSDQAVRWIHGLGRLELDARGEPWKLHGTIQDVTGRKQAEQALLASEYKLREQKELLNSVIGNALDAVVQINMEGIITAWNRQAEQIFGWRSGEAIGKMMHDMIVPERYRDAHIRGMGHFLATGTGAVLNKRIELSALHRDGREFPIELSISPNKTAAGYEFSAFIRDITESKKVEAVLLRHKQVIETAMDGFWLTDENGYLLDANEAYAKLSGYTIGELIGMHVSQLDATDRPENVAARAAKIIARGQDRFETRHRRKDGQIMDVEVSATHMAETRQFFVFCHDITRRKQNEDALRIAAITFETHDAILITDAHSNIIRVNRAFSEITGYSAEEVLGKNPRIMSSGRHDRSFYIEMWQQLLHSDAWAGEVFDRRKNGEVYPKWMTITAVKNARQKTTHYVAIFSDITARKRIEEEIHSLAFYDALTRLPNRRLFLDRFRTALTASARRNDYGAVLFIDLDRFKALNDAHGHDCGDLLLMEVGMRIKSCVREMDTVARFGGDEFVVLIEAVSDERGDAMQKVALVAEKIREALALPYILKEHEHHSSPSIGISLYHGNDEPMDILIEHADMAMYQVKNSGRNAVRFFDPVMQRAVAAHDVLENDLYYALGLQQLRLHYQVQVDNDNRPLGAEAFLRWMHPEHGMIMPGQFLPIAEESGLIVDIGRWVLQTACRQLALWGGNDKTRDLTLTVNISASQFAQPDFVGEVAEVLKACQADPAHLKLELSERLVLADMNSTMGKIHALRNLGVRLSMDNFNTVYSSLSYLKQLSSDQLKIHQQFVQGITEVGSDAQLVQTVIDFARSLDLNIFAEGVETEAQRDFLQRHDCDSYQGYLFSKPLPIEEFEKMLGGMP